MHVFHIFNV
jgi:hypothetical protein